MNTMNQITKNTFDSPVVQLDIAARTLLCPVDGIRSENQDNYLIVDVDGNARYLHDQVETRRHLRDWSQGHRRLAVLDGMGGHSFGRQAAELAVEGLLQLPALDDLDDLAAELDTLHALLHKEMRRHGGEPGCTLTLLEIPPSGQALMFHAGDSRLYTVDGCQADFLTVDHVPATKLAMLGLIDESEWRQQVHIHPGSLLSQAFILGTTLSDASPFGASLEPTLYPLHDANLPAFLRGRADRRRLDLAPGRVYLLASDGLWHLREPMAFIERWPALLNQPERSLEELLEGLFTELVAITRQAAYPSGDNCTAVAFRLAP